MKKIILGLLGVVFLSLIVAIIYGHIEYNNIKIKTIEIKSSEIPKEFDGKKILFVADFQYDTIGRFNKKALRNAIKKINEQEKDIILLGGDYSTWTGKLPKFYKEIKEMKVPKYGVYAIMGNHDYPGEKENIENLRKLGYKLLLNSNDKVTINNESLYISGVTDLWFGNPNAQKALLGIKKEDFTIFMTHNPDYFVEMTEEERERTDIALAGHSHGGQVTFFGKLIKAPIKYKKYFYGLNDVNGNKIYTTSGLGGAAFEMFIRFFAQPEIVILKLERIENK